MLPSGGGAAGGGKRTRRKYAARLALSARAFGGPPPAAMAGIEKHRKSKTNTGRRVMPPSSFTNLQLVGTDHSRAQDALSRYIAHADRLAARPQFQGTDG